MRDPQPIPALARCSGEMTCVCCGQALWASEEELCPACAVSVRLEFRRGLRALERYLERWADFSAWLEAARR